MTVGKWPRLLRCRSYVMAPAAQTIRPNTPAPSQRTMSELEVDKGIGLSW